MRRSTRNPAPAVCIQVNTYATAILYLTSLPQPKGGNGATVFPSAVVRTGGGDDDDGATQRGWSKLSSPLSPPSSLRILCACPLSPFPPLFASNLRISSPPLRSAPDRATALCAHDPVALLSSAAIYKSKPPLLSSLRCHKQATSSPLRRYKQAFTLPAAISRPPLWQRPPPGGSGPRGSRCCSSRWLHNLEHTLQSMRQL